LQGETTWWVNFFPFLMENFPSKKRKFPIKIYANQVVFLWSFEIAINILEIVK